LPRTVTNKCEFGGASGARNERPSWIRFRSRSESLTRRRLVDVLRLVDTVHFLVRGAARQAGLERTGALRTGSERARRRRPQLRKDLLALLGLRSRELLSSRAAGNVAVDNVSINVALDHGPREDARFERRCGIRITRLDQDIHPSAAGFQGSI